MTDLHSLLCRAVPQSCQQAQDSGPTRLMSTGRAVPRHVDCRAWHGPFDISNCKGRLLPRPLTALELSFTSYRLSPRSECLVLIISEILVLVRDKEKCFYESCGCGMIFSPFYRFWKVSITFISLQSVSLLCTIQPNVCKIQTDSKVKSAFRVGGILHKSFE